MAWDDQLNVYTDMLVGANETPLVAVSAATGTRRGGVLKRSNLRAELDQEEYGSRLRRP